MSDKSQSTDATITREKLVPLVILDLACQYQAIIAYVVPRRRSKGAVHEHRRRVGESTRARAGARQQDRNQIDYLGGLADRRMQAIERSRRRPRRVNRPTWTTRTPRPCGITAEPLRLVRGTPWANTRSAEHIREILVQEQEHQSDLATALGIDVPDASRRRSRHAGRVCRCVSERTYVQARISLTTMHVRQPEVAPGVAVGEAPVVEAEQVEDFVAWRSWTWTLSSTAAEAPGRPVAPSFAPARRPPC